MSQGPRFKFIDQKQSKFETDLSKEIRILSEVEKIWILFDIDQSSFIEKDECMLYLQQMTEPRLELSNDQVDEIFELIDFDNSGTIDK